MKTDFKKTFPGYKARLGKFEIIDLPEMRYLMISGGGGPASEDYASAITTLYPLAYALKFASKRQLERDYVVPPLEALWWADDMAAFTSNFDQSQWLWTAMLMVPDWISQEFYLEVRERVAASGKTPDLEKLELKTLDEGKVVQTLHIGPYAQEGPLLAKLHDEFIPQNNLQMTGHHHEIYFNDFRKTAPEKLRTILRQPVRALR